MKFWAALLVGGALGAAELAIAPDQIVIDARQAVVAAAKATITAQGAVTRRIAASLVDPLAEFAPPGTDLGKPVFPVSIVLAGPEIAPGTSTDLTVSLRTDVGESAMWAWQIQTQIVRITSDEAATPSYDVPILVRYHARPIVIPALPMARSGGGGGVEFAFSLRSGDPAERISRVELHAVRVTGGADPRAVLHVDKADGYRVAVDRAADGPALIELAVIYELPAPARKLLRLPCRVGEAKPAQPAAEPMPDSAGPPQRRIRIN